jgi:hypothetical protein
MKDSSCTSVRELKNKKCTISVSDEFWLKVCVQQTQNICFKPKYPIVSVRILAPCLSQIKLSAYLLASHQHYIYMIEKVVLHYWSFQYCNRNRICPKLKYQYVGKGWKLHNLNQIYNSVNYCLRMRDILFKIQNPNILNITQF